MIAGRPFTTMHLEIGEVCHTFVTRKNPAAVYGMFKPLYITALLFLLVAALSRPAGATHIVGGEMNYRYLGNNTYEIKLTVYRDCYNGVAPFDALATLGVFDINGNLLYTESVPLADIRPVPNAINSPCLSPPIDVCYEVGRYYATLTLPPIAGGYTFAYQRCCRNHTIINIINPGGTGATYTASIPDRNLVPVNSNPVFVNEPPTFICVNAPFRFNHSAVDADGDSLVYELCTPYDGASTGNPMPIPPNPPPYQNIIFQTPYSLGNLMGGSPMKIDYRTGLLEAIPDALGQYVYGIRAKEYRNGIYIGETRRDFQVNVTICPDYTVASMVSPINACGKLNVNFTNKSFGAASFSWDFGDMSTTADTSNLPNPSYTYPDTGVYRVRLIAHSGNSSSCNDTAYGLVYVYAKYNARFGVIPKNCTTELQLVDSSFGGGNGATPFRLWNFGDGSYSSANNPLHKYPSSGSYTITLVAAADMGCADTITKTISIPPLPVSSFTVMLDSCTRTITLSNTSNNASVFNWTFGDGNSGSNVNAKHTYFQAGNYVIALVAGDNVPCYDTSYISVNVPVTPLANFSLQLANCDSVVRFQNLSQNASNYKWEFGDGNTSYLVNPVHTYSSAGVFTVKLLAISSPGMTSNRTCVDPMEKQVTVNRKPQAAFDISLDTCKLTLKLTNQTKFGSQYKWIFSDGNVYVSKDVQHRFLTDGNKLVQLIAENNTSCTDTAYATATLPPLPVAGFTYHQKSCDSLVRFTQQSTAAVSYKWYFGDGDSSAYANPFHIYHQAGDIPVMLVSASQYGCRDTVKQILPMLIAVPADFIVTVDSCSGLAYFSNLAPLALTHAWDLGDLYTSSNPSLTHTYSSNGDYMVTYTANPGSACETKVHRNVSYQIHDGEYLYIPNAFTPNDDGRNDEFRMFAWQPCDYYSLVIMNRWGETIFETSDAFAHPWNGLHKGKPVAEGVYTYILKGSRSAKSGYVVVIR